MSDRAARNYRRRMTTAGAIVIAMISPFLLGQLLYALSRGKPSREYRD